MRLIDSHTHTQFAAFAHDYKEVIKRAQKLEIGMINVGTQKDTSKRAVEIAHEFENIWATVGLHPIHIEKSYHDPQEIGAEKGFNSREESFDYEYYKKLASNPKVVAIGECGLDYYCSQGNQNSKIKIQNLQKEIFIKQIELAQELNKPLMIHCRPSRRTNDAYGDLYNILRATHYELRAKIMHFYAGSLEMAKKLLEMGCYFTFGGVITFSRDYDEIIKYLPLEKIMVETDAPYVAPEPYRGQRNEPAYVVEVAKKLAEIKGADYERIAEVTTKNCQQVFKI